jgi:low affinity Fe/Cu permease
MTQEIENEIKSRGIGEKLARFATWISDKSGTTPAFLLALLVVVVWAATGPIFHYSDTWQLVINTGTTVVTFLMVFLIQHAQNKDTLAVQLKLNELVAAIEGASNRLISVEDLSDDDLLVLRRHYRELALMSQRESRITESHSVDEAKERHARKKRLRNKK